MFLHRFTRKKTANSLFSSQPKKIQTSTMILTNNYIIYSLIYILFYNDFQLLKQIGL